MAQSDRLGQGPRFDSDHGKRFFFFIKMPRFITITIIMCPLWKPIMLGWPCCCAFWHCDLRHKWMHKKCHFKTACLGRNRIRVLCKCLPDCAIHSMRSKQFGFRTGFTVKYRSSTPTFCALFAHCLLQVVVSSNVTFHLFPRGPGPCKHLRFPFRSTTLLNYGTHFKWGSRPCCSPDFNHHDYNERKLQKLRTYLL